MTGNPSKPSAGGDPSKPRCAARRSTDGEPCGNYPARGSRTCRYHGGKAPQVIEAAEQRILAGQARAAVATLGLPADLSPIDALLEEVARSAGVVRWLEERVRALDPARIIAGTVTRVTGKQAQGHVEFTEHRTGTHPLIVIYQHERGHLVAVCKAAISCGVAERQVAIAERLGSAVADVLEAVLDDLGLSDGQRETARESVPRRLRLLAGDLNHEGMN